MLIIKHYHKIFFIGIVLNVLVICFLSLTSIIINLFINNSNVSYSVLNNKLVFKAPPNLSSLYDNFNNFSSEINNKEDNMINCKFYDVNEIRDLKKMAKKTSLSLFHLNITSLSKHIFNLEQLLSTIDLDFDILAFSESRIYDNSYVNNLQQNSYSLEFCSTLSNAGGTAIYINNSRSYVPRPDLKITKASQQESNFIELVVPKKIKHNNWMYI